jgi:hypothetical protein
VGFFGRKTWRKDHGSLKLREERRLEEPEDEVGQRRKALQRCVAERLK